MTRGTGWAARASGSPATPQRFLTISRIRSAVSDGVLPTFTPTADAGIGYYELGVAREANVLVVLQLNAMGNPAGEGADDWVWTSETLQTALDRAVR